MGITKERNPKDRWQHGNGYKDNSKFYSDIAKYGWDNFTHEIVYNDLDYKTALFYENKLIKEYDSVKNGYNLSYSLYGKNLNYDFYDFKKIENPNIEYKNDNLFFSRIPNEFIQTSIFDTYGLHRIFLVVWILIDRHRSLEDFSYLMIREIIEICGYKCTRQKPKIFNEILKCILFLDTSGYIELDPIDPYTITYDRCITLKIIAQNFDTSKHFTKIHNNEIDSILCTTHLLTENKIRTNRENILTSYLYIKSYIGSRKNNQVDDNKEDYDTNPLAFWKSVQKMSEDLSMSKKTIGDCINYLTTSTDNNESLLIKHETGYIPQDDNKPPKQAPNIYVLNKEGYEKEIQWALNKIMEIYNVDHFIKK